MKKVMGSILEWIGIILIVIIFVIIGCLIWVYDLVWHKLTKNCFPKFYLRVEKAKRIRLEKEEEEFNKRTANQGWAWQPNIFDN